MPVYQSTGATTGGTFAWSRICSIAGSVVATTAFAAGGCLFSRRPVYHEVIPGVCRNMVPALSYDITIQVLFSNFVLLPYTAVCTTAVGINRSDYVTKNAHGAEKLGVTVVFGSAFHLPVSAEKRMRGVEPFLYSCIGEIFSHDNFHLFFAQFFLSFQILFFSKYKICFLLVFALLKF